MGADEPVLQYRITYHANGGQGGYAGPAVPACGADTVCSLSETGITRSGYWFTGWNTRQDGRGISYAAGDSITLNSDVILYAQWRKIAESGGGTRSSGGERTLWSDDTATIISDYATPASDGAATSSGGLLFNPNTGAVHTVPICAGLLCALLTAAAFLLWAERWKKQPDTRDP